MWLSTEYGKGEQCDKEVIQEKEKLYTMCAVLHHNKIKKF